MIQKNIAIHPLAAIFPMPPAESLQALADDIRTNGLIHPIVTLEGMILDGRCRLYACGVADVEPKFIEFAGEDPVAFVISANVHRRHLDPSQRAMAAAQLHIHVEAQWDGIDAETAGIELPIGRAAVLFGVSPRSVHRALNVLRKGDAGIAADVVSGSLSVSAAAKLIRPTDAPTPAREVPASPTVTTPPPVPTAWLTLSPSRHAIAVEELSNLWAGASALETAFAAAPDKNKRAFIDKIWPSHPRWPIEVKLVERPARGSGKTMRLIRK